jgi:hypothetical protein
MLRKIGLAFSLVAAGLVDPAGVSVVMASSAQVISFDSIPNRTTNQAFTFSLSAPTSSSGLAVALSATGVCTLDGLIVSITDKGSCTLTATQDGDADWLPAESVARTFVVSRVMHANKTITFRTASGAPVEGLVVSWQTPDRTYSSSGTLTTNSAGKIKFGKIPGGILNFTIWCPWKMGCAVGDWAHQVYIEGTGWVGNSGATSAALIGSETTSVTVGPTAADYARTVEVSVTLDDGAPVPGAQVYTTSIAACQDWATTKWALRGCVRSAITDSEGIARLVLSGARADTQLYARFVDGDLEQTSGIIQGDHRTPHVFLADGSLSFVLESLPVVELETESTVVNYGDGQVVTAIARDSDGNPIEGRSLTLSASANSASANGISVRGRSLSLSASLSSANGTCRGLKTKAKTDSAGRATFKVCPIKTATWSVDGKSIVGSAGVRIRVQKTPTAPRSLVGTEGRRFVALTWAKPANNNIGAIRDYIVQYRLQGATTWNTFRDDTSTARKTTVTGLTLGQIYEFRVAAKNNAGTGTWSDLVLGTPN